MRSPWVITTAALLASALRVPCAWAQEPNEVSATGKGITGGALLGGEAVMLTEAALGVRPGWAYIAGGVAGAAGGAVGGYFAEQEGSAKLSLYLLAAGMALAIPTTVAVLSATSYQLPANYTVDQPPADEPVAEPAQPEPVPMAPAGTAPAPSQGAESATPPESAPPAPAGSGGSGPQSRAPARHRNWPGKLASRPGPSAALLQLEAGRLAWSAPAVEVRDRFTPEECAEHGVRQVTEVRVALLSGRF